MNSKRLEQIKAMREEDPHDSFLKYAEAKEYEGMGETEIAIQLFEKLRKDDPEYVGLYFHLARLYEKKEDYDLALEVFDAGIKVAQSQNDLHALSELKSAKLNMEMEM
jgi:tetratricopeptide (TPR) repeat protein